tara:strand:- start:3351 stop:3884 length:534 start_codon:yes stop_codon:yes gene_type:complete
VQHNLRALQARLFSEKGRLAEAGFRPSLAALLVAKVSRLQDVILHGRCMLEHHVQLRRTFHCQSVPGRSFFDSGQFVSQIYGREDDDADINFDKKTRLKLLRDVLYLNLRRKAGQLYQEKYYNGHATHAWELWEPEDMGPHKPGSAHFFVLKQTQKETNFDIWKKKTDANVASWVRI